MDNLASPSWDASGPEEGALDGIRWRLGTLGASRLYRALSVDELTEYRGLCRLETRLLAQAVRGPGEGDRRWR
jgi:hypothetical protein